LGIAFMTVASLAAGAAGQHEEHPATPPTAFTSPIDLYRVGLGPFTRAISSKNAEAQAFFNQGFQLTYAFARPEAVRSFRQAEARDPKCAICYWGEAWAWGSDLNFTMAADDVRFGHAAIQKAAALADAASPVEQALIRALSVRYVEPFDPARRVVQDRAYADAMKKVADEFPEDADVATLYAEALFLLEPRTGPRDLANPNVKRIMDVLEHAMQLAPRDPGPCHFYIHLTETTSEPERATACAEFIGKSIPGASHINHMPAHTWTQVGRWGDAVRASLDAWHSDQKAAIGEGIAIYPWHDLEMLVYAASWDGQGAIAVQAGRDYERLTGAMFKNTNPIYLYLAQVRFGRFEDILQHTTRSPGSLSGPVWDFAMGYARLRSDNVAAARLDLARLETAANTSTQQMGSNPAKKIFAILAGILRGEITRATDVPGAVTIFQQTVALEDSLVRDEPETLPFSARHWLGAALLQAGRFSEAEQVYAADLKKHPHNGWSLLGLGQALNSQHKPYADVAADFDRAFARSDTWIRLSRF
jgi:tetratricopeptide (TPR) repeat protein